MSDPLERDGGDARVATASIVQEHGYEDAMSPSMLELILRFAEPDPEGSEPRNEPSEGGAAGARGRSRRARKQPAPS